MPGCRCAAIWSTADTTYDRSGSLVFRSGVGTQMLMVSSVATTLKSVVALRRLSRTSLRDQLAGHIGDVGVAAVHRGDLRRVDIDADGVEAGAPKLHGQRQADVAESDDADAGAARGDPIEQVGVGR